MKVDLEQKMFDAYLHPQAQQILDLIKVLTESPHRDV